MARCLSLWLSCSARRRATASAPIASFSAVAAVRATDSRATPRHRHTGMICPAIQARIMAGSRPVARAQTPDVATRSPRPAQASRDRSRASSPQHRAAPALVHHAAQPGHPTTSIWNRTTGFATPMKIAVQAAAQRGMRCSGHALSVRSAAADMAPRHPMTGAVCR